MKSIYWRKVSPHQVTQRTGNVSDTQNGIATDEWYRASPHPAGDALERHASCRDIFDMSTVPHSAPEKQTYDSAPKGGNMIRSRHAVVLVVAVVSLLACGSAGTTAPSTEVAPSPAPRTSAPKAKSCKRLDVEMVADYNARVEYYQMTGVGDPPSWPYSGEPSMEDRQFASCVRMNASVERCIDLAGGDMGLCEEKIKQLCCP